MLFISVASAVSGQEINTLVAFTNEWAYNQSGLEPDPDWSTNTYSDESWPRSRGLLGVDDGPNGYGVHAPILTRLSISTEIRAYYFRTRFQFSGDTAGLMLVASNLVDDGCAIYLNGEEVGRLRLPRNSTAQTLASAGPAVEGTIEPTVITNLSLLRQGENLLAVEVHQSAPTSPDVMWGMKLVTTRELPLQALAEPQDLTREVGQSAQFAFPVSGSPTRYRWYRSATVIPGATDTTLVLPAVTPNDTGIYYAVVTNRTGSITSRWATLTVLEDRRGPRLLTALAAPQGISNIIEVSYSEQLNGFSATNPANYLLTRFPSGGAVAITNLQLAQALSSVRLVVDASDPDWVPGAPYVLTVNQVADRYLNVIAPDSRVAITWPNTYLLIPHDAIWSFHAAAIFDPLVFAEPWMQPDYQEGPWWGQGRGVFASGLGDGLPCIGEWSTPVGFQPEPMLFRTTFVWPAEFGSQARMRLAFRLDDAAVVYLNGKEILRTNMLAGSVGPLDRAIVTSNRRCFTNTVFQLNDLRSGTNWVAVAVVSSLDADDFAFEFQMWATTTLPGPLPENPSPILRLEPLDAATVRLSWTGAGYALETTTELTANRASRPEGPWEQVPAMTNPYVYTNGFDGPMRLFRLKQ